MSPPVDPKAHRYDALSRALKAVVWVAAALAAAGLLVPGRAGEALGAALVAVLIAAPLARVVWLVQRWFRRGDPRFGLAGVAVLAIVAIGALLA